VCAQEIEGRRGGDEGGMKVRDHVRVEEEVYVV